MTWTQLSDPDAHAFIKAVAPPNETALFEPSLCEVHKLPVSFYDGYFLTRIVNKNMIPHLLLDYLSNGTSHYYMDGSEDAFHSLNAQGALNLDEENALEYVDFLYLLRL